jgi:hypothetical protein
MNMNNIHDPEVQRAVANLMNQAVSTEKGMSALAEVVAPPIIMEIERKNIVPLVLTEHNLNPGQEAKYQKRESLQAHYVSVGGDPTVQEVNADTEVIFPIFRIHANPMVDISDLANGNLGSLTDMQMDAANAIRKQLNAKCTALLSAAASASNTVTSTGGILKKASFYEAVGMVEDLELVPRFILIRGKRMVDLTDADWGLDDITAREMIDKGVLKRLAGAGLINTASMSATEVIIIPDMEVGKYAIRTKARVDPQKKGFKVGFLTWQECAMGITRPDLVFKINITA